MIRQPAVAGSFYSSDKNRLRYEIDTLIIKDCEKQSALGVVSPHAGYMYSGSVAGSLYSYITIPDTVVILSPNHTGYGKPYSIWPGGFWNTPFGDIAVNEEVVNELVASCHLIERDKEAHLYEHAAEVQLPFIQYFKPDTKIVVMTISSRNIKELKTVGKCMSLVLQKLCPDALVVASSDMTHHEPQESANRKDRIAIDEILALNEDGLYNKVHEFRISMCGIYPAVIMLVCSKERGAKETKLIRYATSGDVTDDYDQVVGYAGIIVR
ncbi:MAG: AmmeMemoRadiSam system protein B [Candidatus Kuenenia sp.]|nr:AmmeMemoRadiSam system protein B [Candidatus Kuenenia hertensis]